MNKDLITLGELEIGDIFCHAADKSEHKFLVYGNKFFNRGYGRPTRKCVDIKSKEVVSKSCPLKVYKLGESKHKEKMNNNFKVIKKPFKQALPL